jgi:hypothetical protein
MVHIVVYRLYTPTEAIALADQPDLLVSRIRSDRKRSPMALIEARDATHAAAVVDVLSRAFGVAILDVLHDREPVDSGHYLLDQGRAMVRDAKRLAKKVLDD